jgi:hypothetical protein
MPPRKNKSTALSPPVRIEARIHNVRDQKIILDLDLSGLCGGHDTRVQFKQVVDAIRE